MVWVRTSDTFPEDERIVRAGSRAAWLFTAALHYSNRHLLDGRVDARVLRRLVEDDDVDDLAGVLVRERLLIPVKGGFRIADDEKWRQPTRTQVEKERRRKTEAQARWRGKRVDPSTRGSVDASTGDLGRTPSSPGPKGQGTGRGRTRPTDAAERPRCPHGRRLAVDGAGCAECDQMPLPAVS